MAASETARRRRRLLAYAAGGALAAAGAAVLVGPAAPWVIDTVADGQRVWRLGHIDIDGVSGTWLGGLRAERVTIEDADGVWIEASDVALSWRPQALAFGAVRIDSGRAARIRILRMPELLERMPTSGTDFDVRIGAIRADEIELAEQALGAAARFSGAFSLNLRDERLFGLALDLRRTDSDADRARVIYRPGEDYALDIDIAGEAGGVFSRLLGAPQRAISAHAEGSGDAQAGAAQYRAAIGDAELLAGSAAWTPPRWSGELRGRLDLLAFSAALGRRIGPELQARAAGARVGDFTLHAETPFLALDLSGARDQNGELDGPAAFIATTQRLSDIARESPFELGPAQLRGQLRRARGTTAIQASLQRAQVDDAFGQQALFEGPVRAALTEDAFTLSADLDAAAGEPALFADASLRTTLSYDRDRARFELASAELESDAVRVGAQGWVNGGDGEFSGQWRVRRLQALAPGLEGNAGGQWRASAEGRRGARIWTTTISGAGGDIGGSPAIVGELLGRRPRLDGRLVNENGGITVSHFRIEGENLRAGASGRIVRGQSDLALEASARGPLTLGETQIDGAVDLTGRLSGRLTRPALTAQASLSSFSAGGIVVAEPAIDFHLAPSGRGYSGRAHLAGAVSGQPLRAAAEVSVSEEALSLRGLEADLAALHASGSASFGGRGVTADLELGGRMDGLAPGLSGQIDGALTLTPAALTLNAAIADARVGELRVRAATISAQGPLDAVAARFELRGRLREAPLAFAGLSTLDLRGERSARIEGRGTLAGADLFTRAPLLARWRDGGVDASLNVALGSGNVVASWRERRQSIAGEASIDGAPLAPLAAIWGERAEGGIDGRIALRSAGGGLAGNADLRLTGARFASRQRGRLDMHVVGELAPRRLTATVDAASTEGLLARFAADAPVVTDAASIRIALAPERRGRATWSVQGPAESLWAAARLQDQSLEGRLDGEGEIAFGAGYLAGDGHIEIADGRFEDKLSGVTLTDLDARLAIGAGGLTIERFTATGPGGGRLSASGGSASQREGRIAVAVEELRIVDRPDARARASGNLALTWENMHSQLSGTLNVIEAELDIAAGAEAGIPTLDVVEINRTGIDDFGEIPAPARRNGSTALDVRIVSPGRVFTRGRGIDAEWALDLRLDGTVRAPLLYGTARAVRGTLALSGQPFEIEEARIAFDGDPLEARIDLSAVRDTADLTARVRLTGTAREPEIAFSSNPPLPEDEILPQILFGRSVADLSALEAAQLASSLATLSGRASFDLVDAARAAVGLDRFNVRQGEDGGILVAGGLYLTREVYVEVARTGLGQAQTRVEWTIRPRLVLITSFLGDGDQRVSLRWRRESD